MQNRPIVRPARIPFHFRWEKGNPDEDEHCAYWDIQEESEQSPICSGLHFTQWDSRLVRDLEGPGVRRQPVLSFLDRKHFLNRQLGELRRRLDGQGRVSALESLRIVRG